MRAFFFSLFLTLLAFFTFGVKAQECTGDLNQRISCYESNLTKLGNSSKTLSSQIYQFDAQIRLTTLKITQTEEQISLLSGRIDQLEGSLGSLTSAYSERVVETYKMGRVGDPFFLLISSSNLSEVFSRYSYLKKIQEADKGLLQRLQKVQDTYKEEKVSQEDLQAKLETQQKQLNSQKLSKAKLLEITKNDEKKYQELLETLRADEDSIQKALSSLISRIVSGLATGSPVTKGQPIGLEGNTGNVFPRPSSSCPKCGAHLHYMVMPCDIVKNGGLSCHSDPAPYMDNGEYAKPMDFSNGWRIYLTQAYGNTSFAQSGTAGYSFHSGLDLSVSYGVAIRSVADGTVYYGTDSGGGKYALVKHRDDFWTAYWHLQ